MEVYATTCDDYLLSLFALQAQIREQTCLHVQDAHLTLKEDRLVGYNIFRKEGLFGQKFVQCK